MRGAVAAVVVVTFNRWASLETWLATCLAENIAAAAAAPFKHWLPLGMRSKAVDHLAERCGSRHLGSLPLATHCCRAKYLEQMLESLFAVHGRSRANRCVRARAQDTAGGQAG